MTVEVRVGADVASVEEAASLFDKPIAPEAAERFVRADDHHLLLAYVDDRPVGMVSGIETTHPDKGTEMFLYELSVDPEFRRRGVATQLVKRLAELARERGCYGMWVLTDRENAAALATYRRAGASAESDQVMFEWDFALRPR